MVPWPASRQEGSGPGAGPARDGRPGGAARRPGPAGFVDAAGWTGSRSHMSISTIRGTWTWSTCSRLGHLVDLAAPGRRAAAGAAPRRRRPHAGPRRGRDPARLPAAGGRSRPGGGRPVRQRLPVHPPGRARRRAGRIGVRMGDALWVVLGQLPSGGFDVVVADVFAGDRTPAHLTSVEFTQAAARVLVATGVYAVSVGDGPPLAHARGRVAAVRAVFPHVCVMAEPAVLHGRRFGNLIVAVACRELPLAGGWSGGPPRTRSRRGWWRAMKSASSPPAPRRSWTRAPSRRRPCRPRFLANDSPAPCPTARSTGGRR